MTALSPRLAGMLSGLWAVVIGASTQIPSMPWWGHSLIVAGGIVLAGLGINTQPTSTATTSGPATGPWS